MALDVRKLNEDNSRFISSTQYNMRCRYLPVTWQLVSLVNPTNFILFEIYLKAKFLP